MLISFSNPAGFVFGPQVGGGGEYLLDNNLAVTARVRVADEYRRRISQAHDAPAPSEEIARIERQMTALERGIDRLIDAYSSGLIDKAEFEPRITGLRQRMVQLNLLGLLYCAHAALPHLLAAAEDGPRRVADMVNISSVAGRVPRNGSGVYNATKHGVGAFSEALRQEVTQRHVRISLVEPGATETELAGHNRPEIQEGMRQRFAAMDRLQAEDIADAITYIVTRPRHVAINELLVRPTDQQQ